MKIYKFTFFTLLLSFLLPEYSYSQESGANSLSSSEIENIIIRSTRIPAGAKDIGSSLYIINEDQIKARGFKDAIDAISLDTCCMRQFAHYDDVPDRFTEAWACAVADVFAAVRDASGDVQLLRALKWVAALHDILLRLPLIG